MRPVHVIIPTHTTRHLRLTLLGLACQSTAPASVTVSCDNDKDEIRDHLAEVAREFGFPITLVRREHQGMERLAQVRNNAVRALTGRFPAEINGKPGLSLDQVEADPQLLFLDGDCFLERDAIAKHATYAEDAELVIPFRVDTTEEQIGQFDEAKARRGEMPIPINAPQRRLLERRHKRYERQQRMKRWPLLGPLLVKSHKPKLLGGHHSVRLSSYIAVNGHDEEYHTWGTEDDDFCRRVYETGAQSVVAIRDIDCLHLYHPTRNPGDWHSRPNAERFKGNLPTRCAHGLDNPMPQGEIEVFELTPA
ncbi:MAG: galactosyltransferase-related protein [Phycisphaerales bacterium JB050]